MAYSSLITCYLKVAYWPCYLVSLGPLGKSLMALAICEPPFPTDTAHLNQLRKLHYALHWLGSMWLLLLAARKYVMSQKLPCARPSGHCLGNWPHWGGTCRPGSPCPCWPAVCAKHAAQRICHGTGRWEEAPVCRDKPWESAVGTDCPEGVAREAPLVGG